MIRISRRLLINLATEAFINGWDDTSIPRPAVLDWAEVKDMATGIVDKMAADHYETAVHRNLESVYAIGLAFALAYADGGQPWNQGYGKAAMRPYYIMAGHRLGLMITADLTDEPVNMAAARSIPFSPN